MICSRRKRCAFIGLGSNLGDRLENLRRGLELLVQAGIEVIRLSALYESEPIGTPEPQPPYLNAVAEIRTDLPLSELLRLLEQVERQLGREEKGRKRARPLDLDILWVEGERCQSAELTVPHPRLWERAFVLVPLADLVDTLEGRSVAEAAEQLKRVQKVWKVKEGWWKG